MSKSLKRVTTALRDAGLDVTPLEMGAETRTAQQAADAAGCLLDQIAKSVIFQGAGTGDLILFITAGGRQVDPAKAATLANEPLTRADAAIIRARTGFAIGGVAPVGHLQPIRSFLDRTLLHFDRIWAAAGTPRHIFALAPADLIRISDAQVSDFVS